MLSGGHPGLPWLVSPAAPGLVKVLLTIQNWLLLLKQTIEINAMVKIPDRLQIVLLPQCSLELQRLRVRERESEGSPPLPLLERLTNTRLNRRMEDKH